MVAINAAATLLVAGVVSDLKEGLQIAYETLASGKPAQTLKKLAEVSSAGA
jgi:anthranilate phosphoribosyltransferase